MTTAISKTQIDRVGERLKNGSYDEEDLGILNQYRLSYAEAYETVVGAIKNKLRLELTGRPKSNVSIIQKLRRESIRLTQMQDIAGCRMIVTDIASQDAVVQSLKGLFEDIAIIDRRQQPSHGYRAINAIVRCQERLVEVQVRTQLQQVWAELSEKISDVVDQAIKYGEGDEEIQAILTQTSSSVARLESFEAELDRLSLENAHLPIQQLTMIKKRQAELEEEGHLFVERLSDALREAIHCIEIEG